MMTNQRTPTESMRASAQAHLELVSTWRYYRQDGVRYVAMTSASSGKVHQVRADGRACDCEAYLVWEYSACSHMLAIREANNRDSLAAWADAMKREAMKPRPSYEALFPKCKTDRCHDLAEGRDGYCDACGAEREWAARRTALAS